MTIESILAAAVTSLSIGKRAPHCYSAWVQGKGYVNDGSAAYDRADYLRQLARDAQSEVDNMRYATGYAEPGHTQPAKGIVFANWNTFPRHFDRIMERLGFAVEWSDEWTVCEDCQRAFRTRPDSYTWTPAGEYCEECSAELCHECHADTHSAEDNS